MMWGEDIININMTWNVNLGRTICFDIGRGAIQVSFNQKNCYITNDRVHRQFFSISATKSTVQQLMEVKEKANTNSIISVKESSS